MAQISATYFVLNISLDVCQVRKVRCSRVRACNPTILPVLCLYRFCRRGRRFSVQRARTRGSWARPAVRGASERWARRGPCGTWTCRPTPARPSTTLWGTLPTTARCTSSACHRSQGRPSPSSSSHVRSVRRPRGAARAFAGGSDERARRGADADQGVGYADASFNGRDVLNGVDAFGVAQGAIQDMGAQLADFIMVGGKRSYRIPPTGRRTDPSRFTGLCYCVRRIFLPGRFFLPDPSRLSRPGPAADRNVVPHFPSSSLTSIL